MKVGDLVKNNHPAHPDRVGLIIKKVNRAGTTYSAARNEIFKVLWEDGDARPSWDYNLKLIGESR